MSIGSKLDWLLRHTIPVDIDRSFRGFFISDLHMGTGDEADDFRENESLFKSVMRDYGARGYRIFILGDMYELWENWDTSEIIAQYPWVYDFQKNVARVRGNHDRNLRILPEAILLRYAETGKQILCVHGHQGDFFNDDGYPLGEFFVRHVWRNLQMLGFKDPTTASPKNIKKHEATKKVIKEWSSERQQAIFSGHTHLAEAHPPYYFNTGSWVGEGGSGIEVVGEDIKVKIFE
jgi:UDP-2,3-diacylglucosamine pyrophosphatase LpxH